MHNGTHTFVFGIIVLCTYCSLSFLVTCTSHALERTPLLHTMVFCSCFVSSPIYIPLYVVYTVSLNVCTIKVVLSLNATCSRYYSYGTTIPMFEKFISDIMSLPASYNIILTAGSPIFHG